MKVARLVFTALLLVRTAPCLLVVAQDSADPQPPLSMTLKADVTLKPITAHPCLLFDAADIPRIRNTVEALRAAFPSDFRRPDPALVGLVHGDREAQQRATSQFMADVRTHLGGDVVAKFGPNNNPYSPLRRMRRLNELIYRYDVVASFGMLTENEQREFREDAVRAVKFILGDDPKRFPTPETPSTNGLENPKGYSTCNRWADQFSGAVELGLLFPDEPMAKAWVMYGVGQIQYMLDNGEWDGSWNEVPRYHDTTLRIFNPLFQALQRRAGVDFFKHPHLKPLLDWYVRFSSPLVRFPETTKRNPVGEPTTPVWGDSNYNAHAFSTLALYAPHFAVSDSPFAKRLMWMWRRAGSPPAGGIFDLLFPALADPSLPDEPQVLGSELSRKLGLVSLRSGYDTPDETWVFMRGGSQGITHKRSDLGSIDLFSRGIPFAIGSQSGPYGPGIEWNYSQQSNNVVVFGSKSRDRGECNGRIDAFVTGTDFDYAVADCSRPVGRFVKPEDSFHWRRHLLLAKHPDYLIVWDEIASPQPSEWFLHTTAEKLIWTPHRITSHTAYSADLDIHVLLPEGHLAPNEQEGRSGSAMPDPQHPGVFTGKEDPYPFNLLKYFTIKGSPGECFLTVLHPRKSDAPPLEVKSVSSKSSAVALEVVSGNTRDRISIAAKDGAKFDRSELPASK